MSNQSLQQPTNCLMLASSYGACFEPCKGDAMLPLTIVANRATGLLHNLCCDGNGALGMKKTAANWDQELFQITTGGKRILIQEFSCILINIFMPLDLPKILQSDVNSFSPFPPYSRSMLSEIIKNQGELMSAIKSYKSWLKIFDKSYLKNPIYYLANPFTTLFKENTKNTKQDIAKIGKCLHNVTKIMYDEYGIDLILPDANMLCNGLYVREHFGQIDRYRDWKTLHASKPAGRDPIHKNKIYGERMYSIIKDRISATSSHGKLL